MKRFIWFALLVLALAAQSSLVSASLPAFPGAEGWGSTTPGGRGGRVYLVTNLNDSGAGSLRDCINAAGISSSTEAGYARTCVFEVGGIIALKSEIEITRPYLTIAGQTAPGGGILVNGVYSAGAVNGGVSTIVINTHDVIIRGLRIRSVNRSAIGLYPYPETAGRVHDVIIDHNSLSWSTDTVLDSWWDARNYTVSWNIIANPIPPSSDPSHNYGQLVGGRSDCTDATHPAAKYVTIHHNLYANANDRTPFIKQETVAPEVVNNLDYNWYWYATKTWSSAVIAGNYYVKGKNTINNNSIAVQANSGECSKNTLLAGTVYVAHNLGPNRKTDTLDDWKLVDTNSSSTRTNSIPFTMSGVVIDDPITAKNEVLAGVGATVPYRDSVDMNLLAELTSACVSAFQCSGAGFLTGPSQAVLPAINPGTPVVDSDKDGMPDGWEIAHGLNPNVADNNGDQDGNGYTNLEDYINSFFPVDVVPVTPTNTSAATDTPTSTRTPVVVPTNTPTNTPTVVRTVTPTNTLTNTPTMTFTPTSTNTPTSTPTVITPVPSTPECHFFENIQRLVCVP